MLQLGTLHVTDNIPQACDTVITLSILASSGQYITFPAGTYIARFTGLTTAGAQLNFHLNIGSTAAAVPSTGQSTAGTTGFQYPVMGQGTFQIPGTSTGFSVAGLAAGYIMAECWKK